MEDPSTSSSPTPRKEKTSIEGCGKHGNEAAEKRLMARIEAECEEHSHTADDQHETNSRKVLFMIILTFIFFVIELTVGFVNRSIALLADSYHMLSDVMALCVALICLRISKKKSKNNGFGWVRAEVLGALVNGTFLLTMCFMISMESVGRIIHPNKMSHPLQVLIVGVIGLLINVVGIGLFHGGHGHSHGGGGGHGHSHTGGGGHGHSHNGDGGHGHSHDNKKGKDHKHDSEHKKNEHEEELELVDDHDHPKKTTRSLSHISNEVSHNLSMMITSGSKQHLALKMVNLNDAIPQEEYSDEEAAAAFRKKMKENENLNMRGVFLHIVSDAIGSVFVVITAAVALWAPASFDKVTVYMDPCLSMILVSLISFSAYRLVKETSAIILGKPPAFVNFELLKKDINKIQGVALVEEVRVWTLVSNRHLATAKVEFCSAAAFDQAAPKIRALFHNAGIHSLTLQPLFSSTCCRSPTIDPIAETPESEDSVNNNDNVQEPLLNSKGH